MQITNGLKIFCGLGLGNLHALVAAGQKVRLQKLINNDFSNFETNRVSFSKEIDFETVFAI